jgi:hypothetical protein
VGLEGLVSLFTLSCARELNFFQAGKILIARMETGKKIHQLRGNCRPRSIRPNLRRVGSGAGEGGAPGVTQARRRQISQRFQYPTQPNYP